MFMHAVGDSALESEELASLQKLSTNTASYFRRYYEKSKIKKIIELALPATIENLLQTLVGFVDTLMVAKIGLAAVTMVGVANSILNVYLAALLL